jgi:hypothetical protein
VFATESESTSPADEAVLAEPDQVAPKVWLYALILISLCLAALHLSVAQPVQVLFATTELILDPQYDSLVESNVAELKQQRRIQQLYLKYGIYVPLDDIVIRQGENGPSPYMALLEKACGRGQLYIWIPLKFQLPLIGERISEWCLVRT